MHFAPPSSLPRAAVGYLPDSPFALSPRLTDRSRRKLCIPYNDDDENPFVHDHRLEDTTRNAILTCAQKQTYYVSLIYRTELKLPAPYDTQVFVFLRDVTTRLVFYTTSCNC